jgi:hypothetical protein
MARRVTVGHGGRSQTSGLAAESSALRVPLVLNRDRSHWRGDATGAALAESTRGRVREREYLPMPDQLSTGIASNNVGLADE